MWTYSLLLARTFQYLLRVAPPPNQLDGQKLSVTWITKRFNHPLDVDDEVICWFSCAYIMWLIGGYLMANMISHKVPLTYLLLLEDF